MQSSGMFRRVALVRTDVSVECIASTMRMTKIGETVTANAPCSPILVTLIMVTIRSSETSVLTEARSVLRLLVTANVPSSPILVTLMMEAIRFSKTWVLTRITWRNIPEDGLLHSHHHENLKFYNIYVEGKTVSETK
jgi:hypothetical protein